MACLKLMQMIKIMTNICVKQCRKYQKHECYCNHRRGCTLDTNKGISG